MSFKSLLTVLTDLETAEAPIAQMVALADALDAHADALCLGVDRSQSGYYYAGANALVVQETLERAQEEAASILTFANHSLGVSGVRWAADEGVTQLADIGRHVAHRARFVDLVIAAKPYGPGRGVELEAVTEAALFEGHVPVLVVPEEGEALRQPGTVLLAWNESVEALAAAKQALPFLKMADVVRVVIVDPPSHGPERSDPGGLLSQMLARHGVRCEIDVLSRSLNRVSDVLNRHVLDTEADLVVMGAYGHSRIREAILGGATRNMLEKATVPVFMAH